MADDDRNPSRRTLLATASGAAAALALTGPAAAVAATGSPAGAGVPAGDRKSVV